MTRTEPPLDQILRAWAMAHTDPVAARSFRAATSRDLARALDHTREMPLLVTCLLAELGRCLRADDPWRMDVSTVIVGELVSGKAATPADRRALRASPVDGAWWHPGSRPHIEAVVHEFGTGRDDFSDIDMRDPSLSSPVVACAWWPLDASHYEPMMLASALHSRGVTPLHRVLSTTAVFHGGEEHGGIAAALWTVCRWLTCRALVTTGRNPAEALGLTVHRASVLCDHHDYRAPRVLTALSDRVADPECD